MRKLLPPKFACVSFVVRNVPIYNVPISESRPIEARFNEPYDMVNVYTCHVWSDDERCIGRRWQTCKTKSVVDRCLVGHLQTSSRIHILHIHSTITVRHTAMQLLFCVLRSMCCVFRLWMTSYIMSVMCLCIARQAITYRIAVYNDHSRVVTDGSKSRQSAYMVWIRKNLHCCCRHRLLSIRRHEFIQLIILNLCNLWPLPMKILLCETGLH